MPSYSYWRTHEKRKFQHKRSFPLVAKLWKVISKMYKKLSGLNDLRDLLTLTVVNPPLVSVWKQERTTQYNRSCKHHSNDVINNFSVGRRVNSGIETGERRVLSLYLLSNLVADNRRRPRCGHQQWNFIAVVAPTDERLHDAAELCGPCSNETWLFKSSLV